MSKPRMSREALRVYRQRLRALQALGFPDYQTYLQGALWRTIRSRVLKAASHRCCACDARICTQVHHESYSVAVLAGEDDSRLHVVCADCHESAHHYGGLLLGPAEATKNLRKKKGLTTA